MQDRIAPAILAADGDASHEGLDRARVEAYWTAVIETLRDVLGVRDADRSTAILRDRLENAGPQTRLMFYHASPIQVASDLVSLHGKDLTEAQMSIYRDIIAKLDPSPSPP